MKRFFSFFTAILCMFSNENLFYDFLFLNEENYYRLIDRSAIKLFYFTTILWLVDFLLDCIDECLSTILEKVPIICPLTEIKISYPWLNCTVEYVLTSLNGHTLLCSEAIGLVIKIHSFSGLIISLRCFLSLTGLYYMQADIIFSFQSINQGKHTKQTTAGKQIPY